MIELIITDDIQTSTMPRLNRDSLSPGIDRGETEITTANNDNSTYFTDSKRTWSHTWQRLSAAEYNLVKGFVDRQYSLTVLKHPLLTISYYGISDIPVKLTLENDTIINNCSDIRNVTLTMREQSRR